MRRYAPLGWDSLCLFRSPSASSSPSWLSLTVKLDGCSLKQRRVQLRSNQHNTDSPSSQTPFRVWLNASAAPTALQGHSVLQRAEWLGKSAVAGPPLVRLQVIQCNLSVASYHIWWSKRSRSQRTCCRRVSAALIGWFLLWTCVNVGHNRMVGERDHFHPTQVQSETLFSKLDLAWCSTPILSRRWRVLIICRCRQGHKLKRSSLFIHPVSQCFTLLANYHAFSLLLRLTQAFPATYLCKRNTEPFLAIICWSSIRQTSPNVADQSFLPDFLLM